MRVRATASSVLIAVLLCLSATILTWAQQKAEWTWNDRDGKVRSRAELDEILKKHELWVKSYRVSGTRAELSETILDGAYLLGAELSGAHLSGAS